MQRRNAAEPFHLKDRKIARAEGADFPLLEQRVHGFRGFFDRNQRVGPMDLIDVDVIGSKPAQGILNLPHDASAAGIARYSSALPLKSSLGGNKHFRAPPTLGDRPANDLLGPAKSIDRGGIDDVDAMFECGVDGSD